MVYAVNLLFKDIKMYGERVQQAAAWSKQIQEQHQEVVGQVWVGLDLVTVKQNVWANQKTGISPMGRHILKPWKVTELYRTSDFTVQYSKTQVYAVLITFGIMFFFNFGFDISFLFMKSFVKKENFRFLLIWRCHISRIWNFSYYYQYDASGRLSLSNPARFWWLIIRV